MVSSLWGENASSDGGQVGIVTKQSYLVGWRNQANQRRNSLSNAVKNITVKGKLASVAGLSP